jgi:O-antigen polymerase
MNLLKTYFVCILSIPFISYLLGINEYFLQTEDYLPVFINCIFSFILIIKQRKEMKVPVFQWIVGTIGLIMFMGLLKVDFINQRFFIKSFLIYILVSVLFLNHYSNKNLLIKDKLQLILIFTLFAFIHIVIGYLFFFLGVKNTLDTGFKREILGVYYNPSFLINTLLLVCPLLITLVNLRKSSNQKAKFLGWICLISLILIFIIILYNKNRAGLVAIAVLVAYNFYLDYYKDINVRILIITIVFSSISLFWIYANKNDSTQGRFLIVKITLTMIKENALFGVGFNNYKAQYTQYQKEYFKTQRTEKEILLADDTRLAHNEWLQLIAEIGIVGVSLFLLFAYKIFKVYSNIKTPISNASSLLIKARNGFFIVVLILSLFSNPFRIPVILNLISILFLFFAIIIPYQYEKPFMSPIFSKKILFLVLGLVAMPIIIQEYYLYKWMLHANKFLKGEKENFSYFNKALNDNENYLFTTSNELYSIGQYHNSIEQLENLENIKNDSQKEILFGLNYSKLKEHDKALEHFRTGSLIDPKLFRPKYLMMNEYLAKGDTISAVKQAKIIVNSTIKIPSLEIDYYIKEARMVSFFK